MSLGRCSRRACSSGSISSPSSPWAGGPVRGPTPGRGRRPGRGGPAGAAGTRPAPGPRPGRPRRSGRPAASPAGDGRDRPGQPGMDAERRRLGATLRALDPVCSAAGRRRRRRCARRDHHGAPLGPRQIAALRELAAAPAGELPAADLAGRHGHAAVAGLVRRGSPTPMSASVRVGRWPPDPSGCAAAARRRATCCRPRPRPSTRSSLRSRAGTRARSCSTA